jgi:adenylate cyclase
MDKARTVAQEVLRINPKFSVDRYTSKLPYKNNEDLNRIVAALRKAGLE